MMADKRSNSTDTGNTVNVIRPWTTNTRNCRYLPTLDRRLHSERKIKKHGKEAVIVDDFCCRCSLCRNFYRSDVSDDLAKLIVVPPSKKKDGTFTLKKQKLPLRRIHTVWINIGDRVLVKEQYTGTVKFIGPLDDDLIAPDIYVGVQTDDCVGLHNGIYKGKRYFTAPRRHGMMVKYKDVKKIRPPTKRPPVSGNSMFPSYDSLRGQRSRSASEPSSGASADTVEVRFNNYGRSSTAPTSRLQRVHIVEPKDPQQDAKRRIQQGHRKGELSPKQVRKIAKWREEFGNDDRASKMAETLKKLYLAQEKGKEELRKAGQEKEENKDSEKDSSETNGS
ncbi:dynactin subunit 1-like isoform X2 [Ptychodera flava]|uniref:dynactin subunit 1-like isoform X2 n=1 Tax=Ptychodera flava TaxID=63121 RepID=UPI00396A7D84